MASADTESLDVELDLLHLLATASDASLPEARMLAVLDRAMGRFALAVARHFRIEEEVARRGGDEAALALAHAELVDRLERVRASAQRGPLRDTRAALIELLDAFGEHERGESPLD